MDKNAFRKKYIAKREALTEDVIDDLSMTIANQSLSLPIWEMTYYHIFLSISEKKEIQTEFLLHILQGRDKSIIVPKANFKDGNMQHFLLQENTSLITSQYGIPEPVSGIEIPPSSIEIVFVPLLTFDLYGNRIGYGKGFYDRFLAQCSENALKVGLSIFEAEDHLPTQANDKRLDYCITPDKVYDFKNQ